MRTHRRHALLLALLILATPAGRQRAAWCPNDPTCDNAPAWNDRILDGDGYLYFPPGTYYFLSRPLPIERTTEIAGASLSSTALVRTYSVSGYEPFIHIKAGLGSKVRDLSIVAIGSQNGVGLMLQAQADGRAPDFSIVENVNITAYPGAMWNVALSLDGQLRALQALSGLRDLRVSNVFLFGSRIAVLDINSVHGAQIDGQFFPAGGLTNLVRFNAFSSAPTSGVVIRSPSLGPVQVWNTVDTVLDAAHYGGISYLNTTNVRVR